MSFRTWLGRQLVRDRLYDEALPVIAEVNPTESVDPASVLFYRGACYHALLMKKEALTDLRQLLENEDECPVRFARTAQLMVADIKPLKEDTLDEISRLMTDVTRRLDLGRSGEDVKEQEQKVIDKLTKLIEKIEEQQQQQQQQQQMAQGQGGGQGGQGAPMSDSRRPAPAAMAMSTTRTSTKKRAGEICRRPSGNRRSSKSAVICRHTTAKPSKLTSENWQPNRREGQGPRRSI